MTHGSQAEKHPVDADRADEAPTEQLQNLDLTGMARANQGILCLLARQIAKRWFRSPTLSLIRSSIAPS